MEFWEKIRTPKKIVAPMVSNSDLAYRLLSRRYGADICYTEMVHVESFLRSNSDPQRNIWYHTNGEDRPLVIQICGNNPEKMLQVAKKLELYCDAVDVNLGCPQPIAKRGQYGAFLQENWALIRKIVGTLSHGLKVPVFCKMRVFEDVGKTIEYAKMIEESGCSVLAVHGRTRGQLGENTGLASWIHIKRVKENLKIPVIANGNILFPGDIEALIKFTGCDGVMVAETHLYNPLIFSDVQKTSLEILLEYIAICKSNYRSIKMIEVRSHTFKILHAILTFLPDYREAIGASKTLDQILSVVMEISDRVESMSKEGYDVPLYPYPRVRGKIISCEKLGLMDIPDLKSK
jgi:tRNA-dihydrouridine synthase 1